MARANLEKSAENTGSSGFLQNVGNGLGFFANQPVWALHPKSAGSWVSRGGPRRRLAIRRAVVLVDRFAQQRHRVDPEAYSRPDAHAVKPEPPTGDTPERHQPR
jgi:hypothetical protein